ncbi:DUF550 domain-containing protein [Salmonella enterica]|nr:DUF550 domain-containing protein [Salmonella enterica]EGL1415779.1 DUF550 domain-containing protein [Salmonella enterica]EJF2219328.1 DUF550 domain-containing protein [Salmonella enterica]
MTTITKERIELFIKNPLENGLTRGEQMELARIAMASLDAEPVRYLNKFSGVCVTLEQQPNAADDVAVYVPLYAAPPASERERIRREHAEWSDKTFGDVGPVGPLKHLSKEALEAAAEPEDLSEWADMQFLLWDAQRRAGITDKQITLAMLEKLAVNKKREWPEPKDGEPRLHIKEQPAPVVPEEMNFSTACNFVQINGMAKEDRVTLAMRAWNACRAAMLQGAEPVSQTYELPQTQFKQVADLYEMQFDDGRTCAFHTDGAKAAQWLLACDGNKVQEYVRLERYHEAVIGNSPVTQDGWISCSERMPAQDDWVLIYSKYGEYLAGQVQGKYVELNDGTLSWLGAALHWMPLPEPPQQ